MVKYKGDEYGRVVREDGSVIPASDVAPLLNDADVIAAVRGAADESAADSTRIGAPGSEIREKYATRAAMLYAAAARLDALLKAAKEAAND